MKKSAIRFWIISLLLFSVTSCSKANTISDEIEELIEKPRPSDKELISMGWVNYKHFGAKADGKTDDIGAIARAHIFANEHELKVRIEGDDAYYIGGQNITVPICTDTDFGNAKLIIDDTSVKNRGGNVFSVNSSISSRKITNVKSLKKNQSNISELASESGLIIAIDANVKRYIRSGGNQNSGASQTDVFLITNGSVDKDTPILWDFDVVTDMTFYPLDKETLTINGGVFTTMSNKEKTESGYFKRGFAIRRSNVIVDGMKHYVTPEGDTSAPYLGFIDIADCTSVTIKNTILTGRRKYPTGAGTYDIGIGKAVNITFENCEQSNDINDETYWGIMGSNYCKNIVYDNCSFSRFDAHQGVANASVKNSTIGHTGINAIGSGTFLIENTTITGNKFVDLRSDYGSSWEGEFIIRNCTFNPTNASRGEVFLFRGRNWGNHDYGYDCHLPEKITIENLTINDSKHPAGYKGAAIFQDINPNMKNESYVAEYPITITKEVILKNVQTTSGMPLRVSDNEFMFRNVVVNNQ